MFAASYDLHRNTVWKGVTGNTFALVTAPIAKDPVNLTVKLTVRIVTPHISFSSSCINSFIILHLLFRVNESGKNVKTISNLPFERDFSQECQCVNTSVRTKFAMVEFALFQIFLHTICEIAPDLRKEQ